MFRKASLALCLLASSLRGDEIEDLKKELAELKQRTESIEARLTKLATAQADAAQANKEVTEIAVRTEVKAIETATELDEAQEQIRKNKEAIERFSSTPLFDQKEAPATTKAFEFHGYARSGTASTNAAGRRRPSRRPALSPSTGWEMKRKPMRN